MAKDYNNMEQYVVKLKNATDELLEKIIIDLDRSVTEKSPVDTGRFKGNWQVGYGQMPIGETGKLDKSERTTTGRTFNGRLEKLTGTVKVGREYWLINNVPYAYRLEHGHSQQAANGIISVALAEFNHSFEVHAQELGLK